MAHPDITDICIQSTRVADVKRPMHTGTCRSQATFGNQLESAQRAELSSGAEARGLEARGRVEMPVMPERPLRATGAHDQADSDAGSRHTNRCIRTRRGSVRVLSDQVIE